METEQVLSFADFRQLLNSLPPHDFRQYVLEVLEASSMFEQLLPTQILKPRIIDILARARVKSRRPIPLMELPLCAIEIMPRQLPLTVTEIDNLFKKWQDVKMWHPDIDFLVIAPSGVSEGGYERAQNGGMDIWDASELFLLATPDTQRRYFKATFSKFLPNENRVQPLQLEHYSPQDDERVVISTQPTPELVEKSLRNQSWKNVTEIRLLHDHKNWFEVSCHNDSGSGFTAKHMEEGNVLVSRTSLTTVDELIRLLNSYLANDGKWRLFIEWDKDDSQHSKSVA